MRTIAPVAIALFSSHATVYNTAQGSECTDIPNWVDQENDGCDWYDNIVEDDENYVRGENYAHGTSRCEAFGNCCESNDGYTAQQACCACGGGVEFIETCSDEPNFRDCDGAGCGYYEADKGDDDRYYDEFDTRCRAFGQEEEGCADPSTGLVAAQACCVCGGGIFTAVPTSTPSRVVVSSQPSVLPTELPTFAPSYYLQPTKSAPTSKPMQKASAQPSFSQIKSNSNAPSSNPTMARETHNPSNSPTVSVGGKSNIPSNSPSGMVWATFSPTNFQTTAMPVGLTSAPTAGGVTVTSSPSIGTESPVGGAPKEPTTASPVGSPTQSPLGVLTKESSSSSVKGGAKSGKSSKSKSSSSSKSKKSKTKKSKQRKSSRSKPKSNSSSKSKSGKMKGIGGKSKGRDMLNKRQFR